MILMGPRHDFMDALNLARMAITASVEIETQGTRDR